MKTEYQIVVDTKNGLCDSIDSFKSLLNINSKITVKTSTIEYDDLVFQYKLELNKFQERHQNIFLLTINVEEVNQLEKYNTLLKLIREIIFKTSLSINVLWDDITAKYSQIAYPKIHKTENLLRKLITKFMVTNVGLGWTDENLPKELKEGLKKGTKQRTSYSNVLHNSDFIQLADFLFKPYPSKSFDYLLKNLKDKKEKEISTTDLTEYIPKSNWERYFNDIVECEDQFFNKRWSKLYNLRCLVAHNSFFTSNELKEVEDLTLNLDNIIEKALLELDKVKVPEENKEELVESIAVNSNEVYANFLEKWKKLELTVISYVEQNKKFDTELESIVKSKIKTPKIILSRDKLPYRRKINALISVRNNIVHQIEPRVKEKTILKYIDEIDDIIKGLTLNKNIFEIPEYYHCDVCENETSNVEFRSTKYPIANQYPLTHPNSKYDSTITGNCNWCNTLYLLCPKCSGITSLTEYQYNNDIECEGGCGSIFSVDTSKDYESIGDYEIIMKDHRIEKCASCGDDFIENDTLSDCCEKCERKYNEE